jgi:hypothetical protein
MEHKAAQNIIIFEPKELEALPGLARLRHDTHAEQIMQDITNEIDLCFDALFRRTPSPLFSDKSSAQDIIAKGKTLNSMYEQLQEITISKEVASLNRHLSNPQPNDTSQ